MVDHCSFPVSEGVEVDFEESWVAEFVNHEPLRMAADTNIKDKTVQKLVVLLIKDLHSFIDRYKRALEWLKSFWFQR